MPSEHRSAMLGQQSARRPRSRRRLFAALSTMAVVAAGAGLAPASATVGPAGIAPGINISVFHNIDFVATFGWPVGETVTVDVLRNGVVIGTETGPTFDAAPDGGALEVNHGPLGAPVDGDCWEGHTPDIRPGDLVRVTGGGTTSEVVVDNISLSGASENPTTGDVEVRGVAQTAAGATIPVAELNSGEFRSLIGGEQFRATPEEIVADPGVAGGFVMLYHAPFDGDVKDPGVGVTQEQRKQSLLNDDGHAAGFGHVAPLPDEAMLVEGFGDSPGPAPGCEGSPSAADGVTQTNHDKLNKTTTATGNLEISGVSFDSTAVQVKVGALAPVTANVVGASGQQTWSASVPMSQVLTLPDGNVEIAMTSTRGATTLAGVSKVLPKDVVAPAAPALSPNGGSFTGSLNVFATPSAGEKLRYGVGPALTAAPAAGAPFPGVLTLSSTQTLHLFAVDAVDNVSPVTTRTFTRTAATPPPVVAPRAPTAPARPARPTAKPGKPRGPITASVSWAAPRNGGSPINGYVVRALRISPTGAIVSSRTFAKRPASARQLKMTFARAGKYRFTVRAVNAVGGGIPSARSNAVRAR